MFMCLRVGKLKWGMEYKGYLVSVDTYMNLQVTQFVWQQSPGSRPFASNLLGGLWLTLRGSGTRETG
jgi:small nuclear ribonucleoprotein (snRNP)-like protein